MICFTVFLIVGILGLLLQFTSDYNVERCEGVCQNDSNQKPLTPSSVMKELYVKISLDDFPAGVKVNTQLRNFTIMLEGYYPMYNTTEIKLEDDNRNIIWTNHDYVEHVYFDGLNPIEFCKVYHFNDIGGPLTINKTGTYKMFFSSEEFSIEKKLIVVQSTSSISLDGPNLTCN
jgi:hypothetical protein